MKIIKKIVIEAQEILEMYVSISEDCTIESAREFLKNAEVRYKIINSGDYDKGAYKQYLENIEITY